MCVCRQRNTFVTGKTHSMVGDTQHGPGLMPRMCDNLFGCIKCAGGKGTSHKVGPLFLPTALLCATISSFVPFRLAACLHACIPVILLCLSHCFFSNFFPVKPDIIIPLPPTVSVKMVIISGNLKGLPQVWVLAPKKKKQWVHAWKYCAPLKGNAW